MNNGNHPIITDGEIKILKEAKERLSSGEIYPSPDAYYNDKHVVRTLSAKAVGKYGYEIDPMGYWFDMQSN